MLISSNTVRTHNKKTILSYKTYSAILLTLILNFILRQLITIFNIYLKLKVILRALF